MSLRKDQFDDLLEKYVASVSRKSLRDAGLDPARFSDDNLATLVGYREARSILLHERKAAELPGVPTPPAGEQLCGEEASGNDDPGGSRRESLPEPTAPASKPLEDESKSTVGLDLGPSGPAAALSVQKEDHSPTPRFARPRRGFLIALILALILAIAYHTLRLYPLAAI